MRPLAKYAVAISSSAYDLTEQCVEQERLAARELTEDGQHEPAGTQAFGRAAQILEVGVGAVPVRDAVECAGGRIEQRGNVVARRCVAS